MSAQQTIDNLKTFCTQNSGDSLGQIWQGKSATYHWNRGKDTATGLVNGVVRKLAGIDANGHQIWVVAGSFKIDSDGTILRFTGIPKKLQKTLEPVAQTTQSAVTVSP